MITIFVGDTSEYLAIEAKKSCPKAQLILKDSPQLLKPGYYYISFGDINETELFKKFLNQADKLIVCPPVNNVWSDSQAGSSEIEKFTFDIVHQITNKKNYKNNSIPWSVSYLSDSRKTQDPQLWIAGCSVAHGLGVSSDSRYGKILSDKLDRLVSWLTWPGTSISWARDQILRSNLCSGDILVWGLTEKSRFLLYDLDQQNHLLYWKVSAMHDQNTKTELMSRLANIDSELQSLAGILQVKNYCKKIGVHLVLLDTFDNNFFQYLADDPDYFQINPVDLGNDLQHPGPKSHNLFANAVYKDLSNKLQVDQ